MAVARALVTRPRLMVADEPTGNLDSRTSIEIMALFQELGRSGITLLLVTHEPDIARYASRVVVMRDGLVQTDRQQEPLVADVAAATDGDLLTRKRQAVEHVPGKGVLVLEKEEAHRSGSSAAGRGAQGHRH